MEVGDRVIVKEKRATIKFIGNLEGHPGEWIGIDYDDPKGGKHDGILNGKRFFTARHPKSGSFVKKQLVDVGSDLITAIRDRYMDEIDKNLNENDIILTSSKHIEFIGMEKTAKKQSDIFILTTIVLDNRNVSRPPSTGTRPFLRCRELNLYNNLLHRWSDVEDILSSFPVLEELVLRQNNMDKVENKESSIEIKPWNCSPKLHDLILSDCSVDSETVRQISYVLACISSAVNLFALRNKIVRFDVPFSMAARLRILDLEGNPLVNFSNVVGCFPNLVKMSLVKCNLLFVDLTDNEKFPKLEHLNILENEIAEWESIQRLKFLPSLSTLFIKCKLFKVEHDIASSEIITALLPALKDINRFDIKTTERRSAEIRFINKYCGLSDEKRSIFQEDLDRLVEKWGPPVTDTVQRGVSMVKLVISNGTEASAKKLEKNLPKEITVQRLTEMLCRLFSVNVLHTKIYLEKKNPPIRIELDHPSRTLHHYSPEHLDALFLVSSRIN